jgi:hypothetical protein
MTAILFSPQEVAKHVTISGFTGMSHMSSETRESIAKLLGCQSELIDVLASGTEFVAYSIFDFEGGHPNEAGMRQLTKLTGLEFGMDDDTTILGPLLIIRQE